MGRGRLQQLDRLRWNARTPGVSWFVVFVLIGLLVLIAVVWFVIRSDKRRRDAQDTSVGESEKEQAAKRTRSELNFAEEAERNAADDVSLNEEY